MGSRMTAPTPRVVGREPIVWTWRGNADTDTRRVGPTRTWRAHMSDQVPVPVWVHRMLGDGLPTRESASGAPLQTGSQRYLERWNRVTRGY